MYSPLRHQLLYRAVREEDPGHMLRNRTQGTLLRAHWLVERGNWCGNRMGKDGGVPITSAAVLVEPAQSALIRSQCVCVYLVLHGEPDHKHEADGIEAVGQNLRQMLLHHAKRTCQGGRKEARDEACETWSDLTAPCVKSAGPRNACRAKYIRLHFHRPKRGAWQPGPTCKDRLEGVVVIKEL